MTEEEEHILSDVMTDVTSREEPMVQAQWTGYDGSFNQPGVSHYVCNQTCASRSIEVHTNDLGQFSVMWGSFQ